MHPTGTNTSLPSASAAASRCPFSHGRAPGPGSLADSLKERTREAHTRAERHALQAAFVQGAASREQYAAWLGQMHPVWQAVDGALASVAARDPRVAALVKPYHAHAARVAADLAFLGSSAESHVPTPATARFVEGIERAAASGGPGILGVWYVLEGSANGGRFIAKALARALSIEGPAGLTSFDPHGERQREYWQAWRAGLDAQEFAAEEREDIVGLAAWTFDAMVHLMDDLTSAPPACGREGAHRA